MLGRIEAPFAVGTQFSFSTDDYNDFSLSELWTLTISSFDLLGPFLLAVSQNVIAPAQTSGTGRFAAVCHRQRLGAQLNGLVAGKARIALMAFA